MKITDKKVALIHYTLKNAGGEVLDSSEGHEPLAYLHGAGNIIVGLESALEGKAAGDKLEVSVEAAEAYGEYDESLVQPVPSSQFGEHEVEVGLQFHADTAIGPRVVTVTAIDGDDVIIDANHSLAGEDLHFAVEVVEVREPSAEELDHGHVHGPGGHEH
ncbi:peptidylprolyl isomerase [Endozoicomonas sp. OPT23]|uniref:FKBP-type peptidyl-prolyl cis-trans isomerase n=1 Tax=Endozoicomonas sp. OPT23 TaxID=2072845 RepID=UPI00129AEDEE|nr:peptidylprolyl isomerase [Endozoicomonas sp. OPT23]MRI32001.1 peptidylprolyl isomerase [Endozoicomonas sp. OPT23]